MRHNPGLHRPTAHAVGIMKNDRVTRRLTTAVTRRYWKRIFTDDFSHHVTSEMYAMMTSDIKNHGHGDQDLPEIFDLILRFTYIYFCIIAHFQSRF